MAFFVLGGKIMSWIYLIIAGIFEVVWATTMKMSEGFSILSYSLATIIGMIISFGGLILATKNLQLSIAYPVLDRNWSCRFNYCWSSAIPRPILTNNLVIYCFVSD